MDRETDDEEVDVCLRKEDRYDLKLVSGSGAIIAVIARNVTVSCRRSSRSGLQHVPIVSPTSPWCLMRGIGNVDRSSIDREVMRIW